MTKMIYHTVCALEQYGSETWPFSGGKLVDAIAWLQQKLLDVPEQYRGAATLDIEFHDSYDMNVGTLEIAYGRPETDAERDARVSAERDRLAKHRANEIISAKSLLAHIALEEEYKALGAQAFRDGLPRDFTIGHPDSQLGRWWLIGYDGAKGMEQR